MTHGSAPCDGEDATLLRSVGRRNQKQNRGDDRSSIGDSILPLALRHEIGYSRVEAEGEHMADPSPRLDLPQGTLDLLILKAIALDPQHGWAISERIQQISNNALQVNQGSLYPALHRLERRGWIAGRRFAGTSWRGCDVAASAIVAGRNCACQRCQPQSGGA